MVNNKLKSSNVIVRPKILLGPFISPKLLYILVKSIIIRANTNNNIFFSNNAILGYI